MKIKPTTEKSIKDEIRNNYGAIARTGGSCCGPASSCGCSPASEASKNVGYSQDDLSAAPDGANLGLGCGNPVAIASLRNGETVLDLGSGGGFDAFLAAKKVGSTGRVIGVDMTPEMIERATANAKAGRYSNVEFRLGEIENLPVDDNSVDVIISNCVINLSSDKSRVFAEAFRVLKPGGRLMVSDTVMTRPIPESIRKSVAAYIGCVSGALMKDEYLSMLRAAGFVKTEILKDAPLKDSTIDFVSLIKELGFPVDKKPEELAGISAVFKESISSITVSAFKKSDAR
ncbi:arsenite methyltransferase [uncultured Methanoregula sp.]|uniref:arsenite methyltransferase n=1 Tax=uncultured Methanoregula sp. TaxID=1005933 RepID=UPI002AAA6F1F|nr:arsenite methyltransferase [uncultured Methanoregula sp.]